MGKDLKKPTKNVHIWSSLVQKQEDEQYDE